MQLFCTTSSFFNNFLVSFVAVSMRIKIEIQTNKKTHFPETKKVSTICIVHLSVNMRCDPTNLERFKFWHKQKPFQERMKGHIGTQTDNNMRVKCNYAVCTLVISFIESMCIILKWQKSSSSLWDHFIVFDVRYVYTIHCNNAVEMFILFWINHYIYEENIFQKKTSQSSKRNKQIKIIGNLKCEPDYFETSRISNYWRQNIFVFLFVFWVLIVCVWIPFNNIWFNNNPVNNRSRSWSV